MAQKVEALAVKAHDLRSVSRTHMMEEENQILHTSSDFYIGAMVLVHVCEFAHTLTHIYTHSHSHIHSRTYIHSYTHIYIGKRM